MSTNDVPGHKPENQDKLAMGCWAEAEREGDDSLILVESVENHRVIFSVFDLAKKPMMEYRTAMAEGDFKGFFSWKPGEQKPGGKWRWHDKTQFPWNKIIKEGQEGVKFASAEEQLSAADEVRAHLRMRAEELNLDKVRERTDQTKPGRNTAEAIMGSLGRTLDNIFQRKPVDPMG